MTQSWCHSKSVPVWAFSQMSQRVGIKASRQCFCCLIVHRLNTWLLRAASAQPCSSSFNQNDFVSDSWVWRGTHRLPYLRHPPISPQLLWASVQYPGFNRLSSVWSITLALALAAWQCQQIYKTIVSRLNQNSGCTLISLEWHSDWDKERQVRVIRIACQRALDIRYSRQAQSNNKMNTQSYFRSLEALELCFYLTAVNTSTARSSAPVKVHISYFISSPLSTPPGPQQTVRRGRKHWSGFHRPKPISPLASGRNQAISQHDENNFFRPVMRWTKTTEGWYLKTSAKPEECIQQGTACSRLWFKDKANATVGKKVMTLNVYTYLSLSCKETLKDLHPKSLKYSMLRNISVPTRIHLTVKLYPLTGSHLCWLCASPQTQVISISNKTMFYSKNVSTTR